MRPRKILMIDDHAMVREGTRMLLEKQGMDAELFEAGSFVEAERVLAERADIDWILLDLGLPDIAGMTALDRLRRDHASVPVVVLSASEERALVLECINRGASGFIGKSSSGAQLIDALRVVFAGGVHLPATLFGQSALETAPPEATIMAAKQHELLRLGLTPRQIEVLDLMVQGLSNRLIAERLELSEATIKTHVAATLRGLNVKNRTQAVFALAKWGHTAGRGAPPAHE